VIARRGRLTLVAIVAIVGGTAGFLGTAPAGAQAEQPAHTEHHAGEGSPIFGDLFSHGDHW
jgi:hypothetical protein